MRSTPDDPLIAIKFNQGAILKARSWAVAVSAKDIAADGSAAAAADADGDGEGDGAADERVAADDRGESRMLSTAAMPRDMTPVEISELERAFDHLVTVLRSGPLTAATYDPAGFELRFVFPRGTFVVHPMREFKAEGEPERSKPFAAALTWTERWELQHDGQRIHPDMDERTLISGPF